MIPLDWNVKKTKTRKPLDIFKYFTVKKRNICDFLKNFHLFVLKIILSEYSSSPSMNSWSLSFKLCNAYQVIASGIATILWQIKYFSSSVVCVLHLKTRAFSYLPRK